MRARDIENVEARQPAVDNLPLVFSTRIMELWAQGGCLADPGNVRGLHDMRIATKRVRYLLEFFEDQFSDDYQELRGSFKRLQDLLGEVHDCNQWVQYLIRQLRNVHLERLGAIDELAEFPGANPELELAAAAISKQLKTGPEQGLILLIKDVCQRKHDLHATLVSFWRELNDSGFRTDLLHAVAWASAHKAGAVEPPPATDDEDTKTGLADDASAEPMPLTAETEKLTDDQDPPV